MKPEFSSAGHVLDPLDHVKQLVEQKAAVLLDVREEDEWAAGHLAEAQLLPLSRLKSATPASIAESLPKDRPVYVHCKSGGRVLMFAEALQNHGVDLRPLRAGYESLVQAGFKKAE